MPFGELLKRSNLNESQPESPTLNGRQQTAKLAVALCDEIKSNTNYACTDDNQQTISSLNQQTITSANQIRISPSYLSHNSIQPTSFSRNNSTNQLFNCIYEEDNGDEKTVHTIIIDCSGISTIDSAGVRCFEEVIQDFQKISLHCYLSNCPSPLLLMFKRMKFIDKLPSNAMLFATTHDAVLHAFNRTNQLQKFKRPAQNQENDNLDSISSTTKPELQTAIKELKLINQARNLTIKLDES